MTVFRHSCAVDPLGEDPNPSPPVKEDTNRNPETSGIVPEDREPSPSFPVLVRHP
jgi:hypothetical protein